MAGSAFQLEIQKFLNGFQSLSMAQRHLQEKFAIDIKTDTLIFADGSVEPVWVYNYNILKARGGKKIENEARGLVMNAKNEVVSCSFPRFFNIHEGHAAKIDWNTARLEEKFDGSLIVIYGYKGEVFIQTRRSAGASGRMNNLKGPTYENAVMEVLARKFPTNPYEPFEGHENYLERYSWVFEYVGPDNRLVTPYDEPNLLFLTAFRKESAWEVLPKYTDRWAKSYGFDRPKCYGGFEDADDAIAFVKSTCGPLAEGFIVVDRLNRRVKIKNPAYLAVSRAINAGDLLSPKHFAKIVLDGDAEETASYFDEYANILLLMDSTLEEMVEEIDNIWIFNKGAESQKEFAEAVKHHKLSHLLFMAWRGKIDNFDDVLPYIKPEVLIAETKNRHKDSYEMAIEEALAARGQKL